MTRISVRFTVAMSVTILLGSYAAFAQSPKDVKGWRGAEWGMTVEQVAQALNVTLGKHQGDTNTDYVLEKVPVGAWTAEVHLVFTESAPKGLPQAFRFTRASLTFDMKQTNFEALRNGLIETYGPVMAENRHEDPDNAEASATWTFPSTNIECAYNKRQWSEYLYVYLSQHVGASK
jgi:hypothetical protein